MVGRLDADLAADVAVVDGLEGGELGGVVVVELEGLADVERISVAEGDGVGRAEALADDAIAIDEGTVGRVGVFDEESAVDLAGWTLWLSVVSPWGLGAWHWAFGRGGRGGAGGCRPELLAPDDPSSSSADRAR